MIIIYAIAKYALYSMIVSLNYQMKEKELYECGGTVERALDENDVEGGPYRVWAFGESYPGLAMSRSIGDMDAKKIGVISNHHNISIITIIFII